MSTYRTTELRLLMDSGYTEVYVYVKADDVESGWRHKAFKTTNIREILKEMDAPLNNPIFWDRDAPHRTDHDEPKQPFCKHLETVHAGMKEGGLDYCGYCGIKL